MTADRERIEEQFVELIQTGTASEAEALAGRLRKLGIIALANAEVQRPVRGGLGMPEVVHAFVVVHETDLERAHAALAQELGSEGSVAHEDIEAAMAAAAEDPQAATAWYDDPANSPPRWQQFMWRIFIATLVGCFVWFAARTFF